MSGEHPNDSIIEIGQNTEESPGNLRKLAVTQKLSANARVKNSQKSDIMIIILNIKDGMMSKVSDTLRSIYSCLNTAEN